jgi:hypothetical protein
MVSVVAAGLPAGAQEPSSRSTSGADESASSPAASPHEELPLNDFHAMAMCRDGTFINGDKPSAYTCLDRGGVEKWLSDADRSLLM